MIVKGKNPVLELLRSGQEVEKLFLKKGLRSGKIQQIRKLALQRGVPLVEVPSIEKKFPRCGGVVAFVAEVKLAEESEVLRKNLVLCLDQVEDPQNVGAIIRSAEAFGAGVILTKRHSAPLSEAVVKSSAGAVFWVPVHRTTNLPAFILRAKEEGFWTLYAEAEGERDLSTYIFPEKVLIVVGSEGKGVRKSVKGVCDESIRIPVGGKLNSLNVSVAAGIILYSYFAQRKIRE